MVLRELIKKWLELMKTGDNKCKQKKRNVISVHVFSCCFIYLLFAENLFGQKQISISDKNRILFQGNYLSLNFSVLEAAKANIQRKTGTYPMSSSKVPGIKLGLLYQINYNTKVSVNTGLEAAILGNNFIFEIDKNKYFPPLKQDYSHNGKQTRNGTLVVSMPLSLEKRFWYEDQNYLKAEIGIVLNYNVSSI